MFTTVNLRRIFSFCFLVSLFHFEVYAQDTPQMVFETKPFWVERFAKRGVVDSSNWAFFTDSRNYQDVEFTDSIGNVFVKNGKLHIVATKDPRRGKVCSSGRISTLGRHSFLYGRIEIRAKVPTGKGICPAIWMLREDHPRTFPLGEIDIMEYMECYEKKRYASTIHIVEKEPGHDEIRHKHTTRVDTDLNKYHVYTFEWSPEALVFKLDKEIVYSLNKSEAEFWPFDAPYYLILNVGYGGWAASCGKDVNIFPCEMVVDWVKYYKLNQ